MKNKLAMFTGAYLFTTLTAGVYAYKKISELKQQRDNQFNALELLSKNNEENWQKLFKEYEEQLDRANKSDKLVKELKHVISNQNIRKMELFVALSEKDSEILKLKSKVSGLIENNENLGRDLGDAQLALQSNDVELKSLRARLAEYENPDELAVKL